MLSKSYSLLNFLNRSHSPAFRHGVGGAAYAGTLAVTGRPSIARLVRTQFVHDETKYALPPRRLGAAPRLAEGRDRHRRLLRLHPRGGARRPRGAGGVHRLPARRPARAPVAGRRPVRAGGPHPRPARRRGPRHRGAAGRLPGARRRPAAAHQPGAGRAVGPGVRPRGRLLGRGRAHGPGRPRGRAAGGSSGAGTSSRAPSSASSARAASSPTTTTSTWASPSTPSTPRCSTGLVEALERSPRYVVKKLDDAQERRRDRAGPVRRASGRPRSSS